MENRAQAKLSTSECNNTILLSKYGYVFVNKEDYENTSLSVISFSNLSKTLRGTVNKGQLLSNIELKLKPITGKREMKSISLSPYDKIKEIYNKISTDEEKYSPSQHRLISSIGKIRELKIGKTLYEENIKNNQILIIAPRESIHFSSNRHGNQIGIENNNIIHKLYGEDSQIAFVDKPIKSDVHYIEFALESEPDEGSVIIGVAIERSDYYVDDYYGFWGYVLSDSKLVSENNTKTYGKRCKMGDKVGMKISVNEKTRTVEVSYYLNGENLGVAFDSLELNTYYPSVVMLYECTKVKLIDKALMPEDGI